MSASVSSMYLFSMKMSVSCGFLGVCLPETMDRLWGRGEDGDAKVAKAYDLRDEYKTIKTQYDAFLGKFTLLVQSVKARAKKGKENECTQVKGARLAAVPHRHALG